MLNRFRFLPLILLVFSLSGCGKEATRFVPGDMQKDFCGTHLNYQYCDCAFRGQFCKEVAMSSDEAKEYAKKEYDVWVEKNRMAFNEQCVKDNGIPKKDVCKYCSEGKISQNGKCVRGKKKEANKEAAAISDGAVHCTNDNECLRTCENNVLKQSACNLESNTCGEVTLKDCSIDHETFGNLVFPMVCSDNACRRDEGAIKAKREELENEIRSYEPQTSQSDRLSKYKIAEIQAGKFCQDASGALLGPILDFTGMVASTTEGESDPRLDKSAEYAKNIQEEGKAPDLEEFKALCCDLQRFFEERSASASSPSEEALDKSKALENELELLPKL